jgi:serine/threonine protein kinase
VLVDSEGRALLADFGFSRVIGLSNSSLLCQGTTAFMAPEMFIVDEKKINRDHDGVKVDVFAFGTLIYQVLSPIALPSDKMLSTLAGALRAAAVRRKTSRTSYIPRLERSKARAALMDADSESPHLGDDRPLSRERPGRQTGPIRGPEMLGRFF